MPKIRVIARIDVKNEFAIKGIQLEGLRKVGDPNDLAKKYYNEGVDEIIFMDAVAAYYDRNSLSHIIEKACDDVFVPITVGGGIRKIDDISLALKSGADKVAINTAAVRNPDFITEAKMIFGSQCIIGSIEAKQTGPNKWEVYTDNGREPSGKDVIDWAHTLVGLGVGEILVTSIDREGTKKGYDLGLMKQISEDINIPVIASGGPGNLNHIKDLHDSAAIDGACLSTVLHYDIHSIQEVKSFLLSNHIEVRKGD
jgi:cyclase